MDIIGTCHKFTHNVDCPILSIFSSNIFIDDEPISIIASVKNHDNERFIIDSCGKLYGLQYTAYWEPIKAMLLCDLSITNVKIKKIFCAMCTFYMLDESKNLYEYDYLIDSRVFKLVCTNVVDMTPFQGTRECVVFNVDGTMCSVSDEKSSIDKIDNISSHVKKYNLSTPLVKINCESFHINASCNICLDANGTLSYLYGIIEFGIKYFDVIHCFRSEYWIIYSGENNTVCYGCIFGYNPEKGRVFGLKPEKLEIKKIHLDTNVIGVFIFESMYKILGYTFNMCYITSNGIYKINRNTNQGELLTTNYMNYMVNAQDVKYPTHTKSARHTSSSHVI